jgi:hypothetical protein
VSCRTRTPGTAGILRALAHDWRTVGAALHSMSVPDADQRPPELIPLPPPWLDAEAYRDLNETFYGTQPHEYFATRLDLLMAYAGAPGRIDEILADGLEYRGLKVGPDSHQSTGDDELDRNLEARRHHAYVLTEAVTLVHHLGETLLRLYLAHAPTADGKVPPAPWLKVARPTPPVELKNRLSKRFDGVELTDRRRLEIETVFYLSKQAAGDEHAAAVDESVQEIEKWLQHFAAQFLDDATIYNSLKHGLTVLAGEAAFRIGPDEQPILDHAGPSVRYLERTGPQRVWGYKDRFVDPDYLIVEGRIALLLLQLIVQVGRARYLGEPLGRVEMLQDGHFKQFGDPRTRERWLKRLSFPVGYRYRYKPPLTCSVCGHVAGDTEDLARGGLASARTDTSTRSVRAAP